MNSIPDTANTILYNIGILFSYTIAIGSICLGNIQAGLIFLFCIVLLTILSFYFLSNTVTPINNIVFDSGIGMNISIISFTLLYIASARMYINENTPQYLGVVATSSLILLCYAYIIKFVKRLPYIKVYMLVSILSSILGMIGGIVICGLNPQFILIGNNNSTSTNSKCSTTPGNTFKCSFISNEDGTEIDLDDILNK